ncbi:hypothetical protein [Microbulbifer sp. SSSA002]|uniref:hypothetical protein n=1 Tax=Microbulbifer sp. SSSA002 TaxID=3243376 RepID=UPI004039CCC3
MNYDPAISNIVNITNCKKEMMEVISASELTVSEIITESSEVSGEGSDKRIQSALKAVVSRNS